MPNDTFYFSHDYNARTDPKIKRLLVKHGFAGYGAYWAIIEDLYNNANALPTQYDCIAYDLRLDCEVVESIINDFELFVVDGDFFRSNSVQRRLDVRNEKSIKARESAEKRWNKNQPDANALPTQCEPNAIKERKGKEKKEKSIEERANIFQEEVHAHTDYSQEMRGKFITYWTEPNKAKSPRMRFELEKTWSTAGRLTTWASRQYDRPANNGQKPIKKEYRHAMPPEDNKW